MARMCVCVCVFKLDSVTFRCNDPYKEYVFNKMTSLTKFNLRCNLTVSFEHRQRTTLYRLFSNGLN